ncbi:MAG: hypothetical protein LLF76_03815 [Planctomycetaceae bacterium]|nr:hypothetical protein [Planctomycetaceae bacterium]
MKKELLLIAMIWVISLSVAAPAAITVTTATGSGADGGVSNDTNQRSTVVLNGTTAAIRHYDGTRAKATILRFDVRDVGGDLNGVTLSYTATTANRARTLGIYYLNDNSLDMWNEAGICYRTAPALLPSGPLDNGYDGYDNAILTMGPEWISAGTIPIAAAPGLNSGPLDPNIIANDDNGLITLLLYNEPTDSAASYYIANKENGTGLPVLTFPNANRCARSAVPASASSVLPTLNTLSWTNTEPNSPDGTITCDVYFGNTEPNLNKPGYNLTQIASGIAANSVAIPAGMLPLSESRYYWVVDTYDSSTTPNYLGTGALWHFDVTAVPLITADPQSQTVKLGLTAQFSVAVDSFSTPHFTWYHSTDNVNNTAADDTVVGTDAATLSFAAASTDEGYFYCEIVNSSGEANAVRSNTARLIVERKLAHWTLDAADFVGGLYQDVSGESHHADPNGTPSFEAGVTAADGAVIMGPAAFADAGTWYPSSFSGEFTITAWIKWNGENGGFQNILSKMDSWAQAEMLWEFGVSGGGTLILACDHGDNNDQYIRNGTPPIGEWQFVAATFNGTTGAVYKVVSDNVFFVSSSGTFALGTDTTAPIRLGGNAGSELFNGSLDDIQVFNYVLDTIELADVYNEVLADDICVLPFGSTQFDLDYNNNCRVDLGDFAVLAANWMNCGLYPEVACP